MATLGRSGPCQARVDADGSDALCTLRSDIEQAADQDSSRMQARLKYIPVEQLVHYAGKKVPFSQRIPQSAPYGGLAWLSCPCALEAFDQRVIA